MQRGIFIAGLMLALGSSTVLSATPGAFDGKWDVTLVCPQAADGAMPFSFQFGGAVTNSVLHAEHGVADQPGWLSLDGTIRPNGDADLDAHGVTGMAGYNVNRTLRGVPYDHPVTAHFDASQGSGSWTTTRVCNFTFNRS
jgi:hypothetical protein